jgi:lysophospholipase L1-like esterase
VTDTDRSPAPTRYLALGDSYTIGTGVDEAERWPNQLVRALSPEPLLELVGNLGVNGFTTLDLVREELPRVRAARPGLISLLIGVNDVVRGVPVDRIEEEIRRILDALAADAPSARVFLVSVPDYTRTPQGAAYGDPIRRRASIRELNAATAVEAASRAIPFVDIGPVADRASHDPTLVAPDGLHPSGSQYREWVGLIAPVVRSMLGAAPDAPSAGGGQRSQ